MNGDNRDFRVVEAIASSPGVSWFDVKSGVIGQAFDSLVPAGVSAFLAFVGGMALGQWLKPEPETARIAIAGIMSWLSFNGLYLIDRRLAAPRYQAEYGNEAGEDEEHPRAMMRTVDRSRVVELTGAMRSQLQRFGRYYPVVKTPAILAWTKSKYLTRKQIEDVRKYLVEIGAAVSKETAQGIEIELTEWGKEQLPLWAAGDFAGLIELNQSPLPQEAT